MGSNLMPVVTIVLIKVVGGGVRYCLGGDVEGGASGNPSNISPNSTPDHVLVHLGDLPGDLLLLLEDLVVLHLVHLHVHHHLNNMNHLPNNL